MTSFGSLFLNAAFFSTVSAIAINKLESEKESLAEKNPDDLALYKWTEFRFKYSAGYAGDVKKHFTSLTEAQSKCLELGVEYCQAVTCNKQGRCTLRSSSTLRNSPFGESTYLVEGAGSSTSCAALDGCAVYDDRHITVFDGQKISLLEQPNLELPDMNEHLIKLISQESSGDMWLVKSPTVRVQARFLPEAGHPNKIKMRALAVGGTFLNGSKLVIEPLHGKVTWDGIEILTEADSEFLGDGAISARRHNFSCMVQDMTKRIPGIDIKLPKGIILTVNRQAEHVNVHITMPHLGGVQDGLCGNNNGDSSDDEVEQIIKRRSPSISAKESLLPNIPKSFIKSLYNILTGTQESLHSHALLPEHTQESDVKEPECVADGGCAVYDDQNVVVFDGPKISLLGEAGTPAGMNEHLVKLMDKDSSGDVWLVKSRPVSIQARFLPDEGHPNKLKARSIAVGGAFLNGTLLIEPMNGKVTWDGAEILAEAHSEFTHGAVVAQRHDLSCLVEDMNKRSPGIDVKLPRGVKLTVNRQENHVNLHISMHHMAGQDGLCGNNNGDAADDQVELLIEKRHPGVAVAESLLPPMSQGMFASMFR